MDQLLDYQALSKKIGLSESTLRKWVSARKIPFIKIGGAVRFHPDKIQEFLQEHSVKENSRCSQ